MFINNINQNTVLFGKDQVSFQVLRQPEVFGDLKEFPLKYLNKELLEIAGSSPQLQQLLKYHQELRKFSLTLNTQKMELLKFNYISEGKR